MNGSSQTPAQKAFEAELQDFVYRNGKKIASESEATIEIQLRDCRARRCKSLWHCQVFHYCDKCEPEIGTFLRETKTKFDQLKRGLGSQALNRLLVDQSLPLVESCKLRAFLDSSYGFR